MPRSACGSDKRKSPGHPPRRLLTPSLTDQLALLQGLEDTVAGDATDRLDLALGHRLLVGHDGQRLERRGRHAGALALEDEALDVGGQVGVALVAVAAGRQHELHDVPLSPGLSEFLTTRRANVLRTVGIQQRVQVKLVTSGQRVSNPAGLLALTSEGQVWLWYDNGGPWFELTGAPVP